MDQAGGGEGGVAAAAGEQRLLQRTADQRGRLGRADPPAQDPAGADVGDEGDVDEPGQGPDVGEVRYPPLVRPRRRGPGPVDEVRVPRRGGGPAGGRRGPAAAADAVDARDRHQPTDLVTAPGMPGAAGGVPELAHAVEPAVEPVEVDQDVRGVGVGQLRRADRRLDAGVVGARGDRDSVLGEHMADRLDPEAVGVRGDVVADQRSRRSSSAAAKNADAVLRISFARRSSATSRRSALASSDASVVTPGRTPESISSRSVQLRSVAGLMSSTAPTALRAVSFDSPRSRMRSWYIRTARARVSSSYLRGAGTASVSLRDQSLCQIQDGSYRSRRTTGPAATNPRICE